MNPSNHFFTAILCFLAILPAIALGSEGGAVHSDPIAPVILGVTSILFFAIVGRMCARTLNQPPVLGELLMGVVLGNIGYHYGSDLIVLLRQGTELFETLDLMLQGASLTEVMQDNFEPVTAQKIIEALQGPHGIELVQITQTVDVFSRYGVIFLMFMVGLETSLGELRRVGSESVRVALLGSFVPMLLGVVTLIWLMPGLSINTDIFIGATLAATSVGITARVLVDLKKSETREARVILGAAVMDDILGLILLAVVSGMIVSGGVDWLEIVRIVVFAAIFLGGAIWLGPYLVRFMVRTLCRFDLVEAKMFTSFLFVMILAWFANLSGLATIIGAFTAGLILHDAYFKLCTKHGGYRYTIKDLIMPLEVILVPIFFVLMGIQVKLETFLDKQVIFIAAALIFVATIGKLVSGFGASKETNRWAVGIGMMPRGEVGLIFAAIGKSLGVISDALFSSVVLMVVVTTVISPPLFKWAVNKR